MKSHFAIAAIIGIAGVVTAAQPALARNPAIENALISYADTSLFYQALVSTGVINELDENNHYTVFAPTNEAFAEIRPSQYPCFYSSQCRAQVADVLRDHIVVGNKTLKELVNWVDVPTVGRYRVYVESPFVGDYEIGTHRVLSGGEMHGNMIYRINGVIMNDAQLARFRSVPSMANAVVEQKTITTYHTPAAYAVPGGYDPAVETMTEKTYVVPEDADSSTAVYPAGHRTITSTQRSYIDPEAMPAREETTTVTHTIITEP